MALTFDKDTLDYFRKYIPEKLIQHSTQEDAPLIHALIKNSIAYTNNINKILEVKPGSTLHKKYIKVERELYKKDKLLRQELGIYANDPCPYNKTTYIHCTPYNKKKDTGCYYFTRNRYCKATHLFISKDGSISIYGGKKFKKRNITVKEYSWLLR